MSLHRTPLPYDRTIFSGLLLQAEVYRYGIHDSETDVPEMSWLLRLAASAIGAGMLSRESLRVVGYARQRCHAGRHAGLPPGRDGNVSTRVGI